MRKGRSTLCSQSLFLEFAREKWNPVFPKRQKKRESGWFGMNLRDCNVRIHDNDGTTTPYGANVVVLWICRSRAGKKQAARGVAELEDAQRH